MYPGTRRIKKIAPGSSKLLLSGLLKGSFIPTQDIRELRDLVHYKKKMVADTASEKNRVIKILEDANIKLSSVLSNVDGAVGTKIITDIIEGKHNPDELLKHYHGKMKASKQTLKKSLEGRITKHHQFMLKLIKQSITDKENLITTLDAQIDEASTAYAVEIALLQTIPGVGKASAVSIISEVGGDMEVFATEHHLSSWAGMSPGNNESGGKKKVPEPSTATNTCNQP
jgi:transposase